MNREEHLAWCKQRAMEYVSRGQLQDAVTSMMSDLNKHPETEVKSAVLSMLGIQAAISQDVREVTRYIQGFN